MELRGGAGCHQQWLAIRQPEGSIAENWMPERSRPRPFAASIGGEAPFVDPAGLILLPHSYEG